jgi:hypothetical protein
MADWAANIADPGSSVGALPSGSLGSNFSSSSYWPSYAGGTDRTGVGGGWGNVAGALQAASKGFGGGGGQGSEAQIATNSGAGGGVHPGSSTLEALVQLLMQRRLALLQQATAVGTSPTTKGLLGV